MESYPFPPVSDAVRAARWGPTLAAAATLLAVAGLIWMLRRRVPRPWYAAPWAWVAAAVAFLIGMTSTLRPAWDSAPPQSEWAGVVVAAGLCLVPVLCLIGVVRNFGRGSEVEPLGDRLIAGVGAAVVVVPVWFLAMLPDGGHAEWSNRLQACRRAAKRLGQGIPRPPPVVDAGGAAVGWRTLHADRLDWNPASAERPSLLHCPSVEIAAELATSDPRTWTAWAVLTGPDTMYPPGGPPVPETQVLDGTSNTLLFVEATGRQIPWRSAEEVDTAALPPGVNRPGRRPGFSDGWLSSYHPNGGAYAVMADGWVRRVDEAVDAELLWRLANPNDGQTVDW